MSANQNPESWKTRHLNLYYDKIPTLTGLGTLSSQMLLQTDESPSLGLNKGSLLRDTELSLLVSFGGLCDLGIT